MARQKSRRGEHWIEVGRNTFQIVYNVINVIAITAAGGGLVFAYRNELQFGLMAIAIAVLCFAILHFYKLNLQEKGAALSNPHLWIDEDQMLVRVYKDRRVVKHQYEFRARRKSTPIGMADSAAKIRRGEPCRLRDIRKLHPIH